MVASALVSFFLLFLFLLNPPTSNCRKSDYKRLVLSDDVINKMEDLFASQLEELETTPTRRNAMIKKVYKRYLQKYEDYYLDRLPPASKVGSKYTFTLHNNSKPNLTVETISKRRPLIFQIDDFLSHEECDHIISVAQQQGLNISETGGDQLMALGLAPGTYDDIGTWEFEHLDLDQDGFLNATELQQFFVTAFQQKMGLVAVYDMMRKTHMDFDRDDRVSDWEWNSKNTTCLVLMLEELLASNPASRIRYSRQTWLDQTAANDSVLQSIRDRLHQLTGLPLPLLSNSEDLQVVRYIPGGHYDCHLDSDPAYYPSNYKPCCHLVRNTNSSELEDEDCSSCRFMTVLYYLNDPEAGGETAFPVAGVDPQKVMEGYSWQDDNLGSGESYCDLSAHCKKAEVRVQPKKGRAVLWYNHFLHPDTNWTGPVDPNGLHGGCAVHKGTKWIANNWITAGMNKEHDILSWAKSDVRRIIEKREREEKLQEKLQEENS